jgi:hypothetical protein
MGEADNLPVNSIRNFFSQFFKVKVKKNKNILYLLSLLLVVSLSVLSLFYIIPNNYYVKKQMVINQTLKLTKGGADLKAIKHYFNNAKTFKNNLYFKLFKNKENYYKNDTPFINVLQDVKNVLYLNIATDKDLEKKISDLIAEYTRREPFEALEQFQKDLFENIKLKLPNQYYKIERDLINISKDLETKNKLVKQNNLKTDVGLFLSILSMLIALPMGIIGIHNFIIIIKNRKQNGNEAAINRN